MRKQFPKSEFTPAALEKQRSVRRGGSPESGSRWDADAHASLWGVFLGSTPGKGREVKNGREQLRGGHVTSAGRGRAFQQDAPQRAASPAARVPSSWGTKFFGPEGYLSSQAHHP